MTERSEAAEPLDARGLLALAAIAARGSVAAAAAYLGWSGPTVDHHVRKLERAVGATLLERRPRGSAPTAAGELVVARGAEILALGDRLVHDVAALQRARALPVRLGAFPTMGARIVPVVHDRLTAAADVDTPLEVMLDEVGELVQGLRRGELDLAVLATMGAGELGLDDDLGVVPLFSEHVFLCLAEQHPLAAGTDTPPMSALRDEQWAFGVDDDDPLDASTRAQCHLAGFEPHTAMRSNDYPAILRMIAAGLVIAIVPRSALEHPPSGVRAFPVEPDVLRRDLLLAVRRAAVRAPAHERGDTPARRHASAVERVIGEVRAVAGDLGADLGAHVAPLPVR